jgi:hypothetical protein
MKAQGILRGLVWASLCANIPNGFHHMQQLERKALSQMWGDKV